MRNTGCPVILGAAKTNGSPKPILETNTYRDYFMFILPIHEMFLKSDAETVRELNVAAPAEGVNEGVKILLASIRKNPGKRTNELALLIGKSVQTVERYVNYDKSNPSQYKVYSVRNHAVITKDRITQSGYPNPHGDYFCYILDEQVSLGVIDVPKLLFENKVDQEHPYKLIYLTAQKVREYVS